MTPASPPTPGLVQDDYHDVSLRLAMRVGPSLEIVVAGENLLEEAVAHYDSVLNFFSDPASGPISPCHIDGR